MYRLTLNPNVVQRVSDGALIPRDTGNFHYRDFLEWEAGGGVCDPPLADPFVPAIVFAQFKSEFRDLLVDRLGGIAGRAARSGDTDFAAACDWLALQVLDIDKHPAVLAEAVRVGATNDSLKAVLVGTYKVTLANAALDMALPDAEKRAAWKVIVDKVFK